MIIFFLFAMLLGAALQITNAFGKPFLDDFGKIDAYKNTFGVKHSNILISISQISETLFILAIPFFLRRFGIKISNAYQHFCMGIPVWIVWYWKSRRRSLDPGFIHDYLRNGLRFF